MDVAARTGPSPSRRRDAARGAAIRRSGSIGGPARRDRPAARRLVRFLHGLLRRVQSAGAGVSTADQRHDQGPRAVRPDARRHFSLAVRIQRPRRLPFDDHGPRATHDGRPVGDARRARFVRTDRRILCRDDEQLRVHSVAQRRCIWPLGDARYGLSVTDLVPPERRRPLPRRTTAAGRTCWSRTSAVGAPGGPGRRRAGEDGLRVLGGRLRIGRGTNELGVAALCRHARKEFTWFRPREASFFEAVFNALRRLFS